jgi:hypothetical protein
MRTPSERSIDDNELSPYAPKWARHSNEQTRPSASADDVAHEQEELVIGNVRVPPSMTPRTLDPSPVPDPHMLRRRLRTRTSRLRIAGRALVAAAAAGAAACYWVGVLPSPGRAGTDGPFEAFTAMLPGMTAEAPPKPEQRVAERVAKLQERAPAKSASAEVAAPAPAPVAVAAVAVPARVAVPASAPPPKAAETPAPGGDFAVASLPAAPRSVAVPPSSPPVPAAPAMRKLDAEEIAMLLGRGEEFVEAGDFASARPVLQRAAEAGSHRAALILAGTYDPAVLLKVRVRGLEPEPAKARYWYEKAIDLGSSDAKEQLARLVGAKN